jgi:2-amino-4-hydroxy-6-hydroxymethyldihydropteridine diphosphokinase
MTGPGQDAAQDATHDAAQDATHDAVQDATQDAVHDVAQDAVLEPATSRTVVLALGSNLGDRLANLQRGVDAVCADGLRCRAVSAVFETAPVGGPEQDDFLNAVLLADSSLPAMAILRRCQQAEAAAGRVRTVRWGPRTLDIDVIACGSEVRTDPELTLPHPRAHERAFVLAPWLDVSPDASLPGHGPVAALLAAVGSAAVRRVPGLALAVPEEAAPCR